MAALKRAWLPGFSFGGTAGQPERAAKQPPPPQPEPSPRGNHRSARAVLQNVLHVCKATTWVMPCCSAASTRSMALACESGLPGYTLASPYHVPTGGRRRLTGGGLWGCPGECRGIQRSSTATQHQSAPPAGLAAPAGGYICTWGELHSEPPCGIPLGVIRHAIGRGHPRMCRWVAMRCRATAARRSWPPHQPSRMACANLRCVFRQVESQWQTGESACWSFMLASGC